MNSEIESVLNNFIGKIKLEVPKSDVIKANVKPLYEYIRNGDEVELSVCDV